MQFMICRTTYWGAEHVHKLVEKRDDGTFISRPGWHQVLHYQNEIIKLHADLMNEGNDFATALTEAAEHAQTRERQFVTPVGLGAIAETTKGVSSGSPWVQPVFGDPESRSQQDASTSLQKREQRRRTRQGQE